MIQIDLEPATTLLELKYPRHVDEADQGNIQWHSGNWQCSASCICHYTKDHLHQSWSTEKEKERDIVRA